MRNSTVYNADILRAVLPEGADAVCINETESTNTIARELIASDAPHGTVIVADRQSAGRGRRGKSFFSPEGGIYMSVTVKWQDNIPYTVCAASAVCRVLRSYGTDAKIKWVNDIFIDSKKVCGILCEKVGEFVIIGIGINHSVKDFPDELKDTAASLPEGIPDRQNTVCAVTKELFRVLADPVGAKAYYAENMMLYGKKVIYEYNGTEHRGTVIGLGDNEELLIKSEGATVVLTSGMVTLSE